VQLELRQPDYAEIAEYVRLAGATGWPESSIATVYRAFGSGGFPDDGNGYWVMPTADQERQILTHWAVVVPHPRFDYAYSWGSQRGDTALSQPPAQRARLRGEEQVIVTIDAGMRRHLKACPGRPGARSRARPWK
jgi:hypothetical protein